MTAMKNGLHVIIFVLKVACTAYLVGKATVSRLRQMRQTLERRYSVLIAKLTAPRLQQVRQTLERNYSVWNEESLES